MDFYPILVFLHVLGAVTFFAAWAVEAVALGQLGQATAADPARTWNGLRATSGSAARSGMGTVLVTGIWMMALRWGPRPWLVTAVAGLILIVVVGLVFERRARPRIVAALDGERESLGAQIRGAGRLLAFSLRLRVAVGIALLGLMTLKPGWPGALTIVGAAIAVVIVHRAVVGTRRRSVAAAGEP